LEKLLKKKKKKKNRNKYRRFVNKCEGAEGADRIKISLTNRFASKINIIKNTTTKLNKPKKGYITKSYPVPNSNEKFPYKPAEQEIKRYGKFTKDLNKYYKPKKTKIRNKSIA